MATGRGRDLENGFFFFGDLFPQPTEWFSPMEKLEITRRSLRLLVSTPLMRQVRNYRHKQNPGTKLFFCELIKRATSLGRLICRGFETF